MFVNLRLDGLFLTTEKFGKFDGPCLLKLVLWLTILFIQEVSMDMFLVYLINEVYW